MHDGQYDGGKIIPFRPRTVVEASAPQHQEQDDREQHAIGICLEHLGHQAREAGLQITARLIAAAALAAQEECGATADSSTR